MERVPDNYCVDDPEIKEVQDMDSGAILTVQDVIGADKDRLIRLRMNLAEAGEEREDKYTCPICGVGVYLVCRRRGDEKRFYFRHRVEIGNCPAVTREPLSKEEIEARKYNGAKESRAHIRMKEILAESISRDPDFSDLQIEKVWKGMERATWRKPDVSAVWRNKIRVAFEVQLSTTFLHVIAQRRVFYRNQGGLLCWVFKTFDIEAARMTQEDIFHNNNRNLFLASEKTLRASKECGALMLDCRWAEPKAGSEAVSWGWNGRLAAFSEMTLDQNGQRVFLSDRDSLDASEIHAADESVFKKRFAAWWASGDRGDAEWESFRREFRRRRVILPRWPREATGVLNALYTAKEGRPVGWDHPKFISAAHTVAGSHKKVLRAFRAALRAYGRASQIKAEDAEGRWARKVAAYKEKLAARDPDYERDRNFDSLIAYLFPETWSILSREEEV
ncbi:MAG: hypothetical protein IPH41_04070 [Sulfuritalea sp.]|nr:hypothetical protein [Sulfuritalea sp.]